MVVVVVVVITAEGRDGKVISSLYVVEVVKYLECTVTSFYF